MVRRRICAVSNHEAAGNENLSIAVEAAAALVERDINGNDGGADNDGGTDSHQSRGRR
jgi:hypothetical protein